ncbi:MAG: BTAD domain-containing putative transcriptional regulator [Christensenellales bacterium]
MDCREICKLNIQMLGGFSVKKDGLDLTDVLKQAPSLMKVMCYLLAMRGKAVLPDELVEQALSGKEYDNPLKVAHNLLYRLRKILDVEGQPSYIRTVGKGYVWNCDAPNCLDVLKYEQAVDRAAAARRRGETDVVALGEALNFYRGDFLPELYYEQWTMPIRQLLKNKYLACVRSLLEAYKKRGAHGEVITLCEKAIAIDPYSEMLHVYYIDALVAEKRSAYASQHYSYTAQLLYNEFGVQPSAELKAAYERTKAEDSISQMDADAIVSNIQEKEEPDGPYVCDYDTFCKFCQIEQRRMKREGGSHYVVIFSFTRMDYGVLSREVLAAAEETLMDSFQRSLRKGDVVCGLEDKRSIILLNNLSYESARKVVDRVMAAFEKAELPEKVQLHYRISPFVVL